MRDKVKVSKEKDLMKAFRSSKPKVIECARKLLAASEKYDTHSEIWASLWNDESISNNDLLAFMAINIIETAEMKSRMKKKTSDTLTSLEEEEE